MTFLALATGGIAGLTLGAILARSYGRPPLDVIHVGLVGMGIGVVSLTALLLMGAK